MDNNNLYNILQLKHDATIAEIKTNFKRLALKYHPDRNKNKNANEVFNQIRIAYDILSDPDKRKKYDEMHETKKNKFAEKMLLFLKTLTDIDAIKNIMNNPDIIKDIETNNISNLSKKLIHKILDDVDDDLDIDINELTQIFIHSSDNSKDSSEAMHKDDYAYNTLNIIGKINVTLDDIYHNRLKEVNIKRKIYNNDSITYEMNQYYIPLYDPIVTIIGAGDKIIKSNQKKEQIGDVIINIHTIKDKTCNIRRDKYNIICEDSITLYELFNGFNKKINCFDTKIDVCSTSPLTEYKFDGHKIEFSIRNKGLPCDTSCNRGNLIIKLILKKSDKFNENLKKYFN